MVCDLLPSPLEMSSDRVEKMLQTRHRSFAMMPAATQQLKHGNVIMQMSRSFMGADVPTCKKTL